MSQAGRSGGWKRFAKAGGGGVAASFLMCCVLPLGIAGVAGASIAGPQLELDRGWIIGSGAAVFGTAIWMLDRRRASRP